MEDESSATELDFSAFFRQEYPRIAREIDLMLGDRDAADQVAQEAFTRLYVHWAKVSKYERPGGWVRRVAIRLGVRFHRPRLVPLSLADREPSVETPDGLVIDVRNALRSLSRMQRAAIILRYYRELPLALVAEALGCKEPTAKVHLHRAHERLRLLLAEYGPN